MKKIISLIVISSLLAFSAQAQENRNKAEIVFDKDTHEFGVVPQGTPASYVFNFKNAGKEPLVITSANPSCGCVTVDWTKEPVKPGGRGYIKATYNSASVGSFSKNVTVSSNAWNKSQAVLTIKGEVKSSADKTSPVAPKKAGGK